MLSLEQDFLRGSYPPLITPFTAEGQVDFESYAKLVDFQLANGSHGIVVNGTTAEPSLLSIAERKELLDVALGVAKGRAPVVAATGSQSFAETAELTDHAHKAGASALMVVTPYYVRPPQRGLVAYYSELAKRSDLPFFIYHIPGRAAVSLTLDTLERIMEGAPTLVGMKHAVNDMALVSEAIDRFGEEFRIFVGLEELSFPMMAMGACGMVNAVSNIAPGAIVALYDAVAAGDLAGARRLHYSLLDLNRAVFFDTNPIPIKYMAKQLGIIPGNWHRLPMVPATPEVEAKLDIVLERSREIRSGLERFSAQQSDRPRSIQQGEVVP